MIKERFTFACGSVRNDMALCLYERSEVQSQKYDLKYEIQSTN